MTATEATGSNARILRFCAWLGPAFVGVFLIGAVPLAGFFPPASAAQGAADTAAMYVRDLTPIRLGCLVMAVASALFLPWGLTIAAYTRRAETGLPILYYIQLASVAVATMVILFIPVFWGIGAFRPGEVSPEITQTWNDAGWFGVLFTWPPFTVWCVAIAASILTDRSAAPRFPRWVGYLNLWAGLLYTPAGLMLFFKTGPFSWNGIVVFWIPVGVFFVWIVTMALLVHRAVGGPPGVEPVTRAEHAVASSELS